MIETYAKMKERHPKEVNAFPKGFAFSDEQFGKEMERLGVKDASELLSVGYGGFIRKIDKEAYQKLFSKIRKEEREAMKDDDFLMSMFEYEMGNHEYKLTHDDEEILNACGIEVDELCEDERMKVLYLKAKEHYLRLCDENDWY